MNSMTKYQQSMAIYKVFLMAALTLLMLLPKSYAQQSTQEEVIVDHQVIQEKVAQENQLDQIELEQLLAPIALYPDALLSQILVASTYPLEVVQANRWRAANPSLTEQQVLEAVAEQGWDPSVQALAPYGDLLARLSDDLDWLRTVGDVFLGNEEQVLTGIQNLRQAANDNGALANNEHFEVIEEEGALIIESTEREIIYVPYYDTRYIYGASYWYGYQPVFWSRPFGFIGFGNGFFINTSYYVRPSLFFGGFRWGSQQLVVNPFFYNGLSFNNRSYASLGIASFQIWSHNPVHRLGVRYPQNVLNRSSGVSRLVGGTVNSSRVLSSARSINNSRVIVNQANTRRSTPSTVNARSLNASQVEQRLVANRNNSTRVNSTFINRTVNDIRQNNISSGVTQQRSSSQQRSQTSTRSTPSSNSRTVISNNSRTINNRGVTQQAARSQSSTATSNRQSTRTTSTANRSSSSSVASANRTNSRSPSNSRSSISSRSPVTSQSSSSSSSGTARQGTSNSDSRPRRRQNDD